MPQPSYEYAMGRISVLTKKMLNEAQLRRIAEAVDETEVLTAVKLEKSILIILLGKSCRLHIKLYGN